VTPDRVDPVRGVVVLFEVIPLFEGVLVCDVLLGPGFSGPLVDAGFFVASQLFLFASQIDEVLFAAFHDRLFYR
jgi:hypothetical protein